MPTRRTATAWRLGLREGARAMSPHDVSSQDRSLDRNDHRLGVGFLLLWIAATGALLAMLKWRFDSANIPANLLEKMRYRQALFGLLAVPLNGLALAGMLHLLWRRLRHKSPLPSAPGHWLLLVAGWRELISLIFDAISTALVPNDHPWPPGMEEAYRILEAGGSLALIAMAVRTTRGALAWRVCLASLSLASFTMLAELPPQSSRWASTLAWYHFYYACFLLPGPLAMLGVILDWRRRVPRDFLHLCGAVVFVGVPIADMIIRWLAD